MPFVAVTPEPLFRFPGSYVERLKSAGFEVRYPSRPGLPRESETIELLQGASAVIAGGEKYSDAVLDKLPDLRVIARFGVGYDAVDVAAATQRGIPVAITPDVNHDAVAEHTMALLLGVTRSIALRTREIRSGIWARVAPPALRGTVLGIVGLGRIGRSVAVRAAAFGMTLLASDTVRDEAFAKRLGIEWVDLDSLLARSHIVTLHAPLTPETRGMINARTLARMKPGSFLINTARGALVVEEDLRAALESRHLGGAGLDVFEREPATAENPLVNLDNVVLTPHLGGVDNRSRVEMALQAAENVIELSQDRWPEGRIVNPILKREWRWNRLSPAGIRLGE
jgi:D-3-phosphoglycerate dehydrogenase/(S)-sulfolactate dehydrogenase